MNGDQCAARDCTKQVNHRGPHSFDESPPSAVVRRLIVDLNLIADQKLSYCATAEGTNKTTIVNRAIQVYDRIATNQRSGGELIMIDAGGNATAVTFE